MSLRGEFAFAGDHEDGPVIVDVYELTVRIAEQYPGELPMIREIGGRIPQNPDHHVFSNGALCLGSTLRLHEIALDTPELTSYAEKALVPYLYAVSHWERTGERFLFGELDHGATGLLDDYAQILDLDDSAGAAEALRLLGTKRRKANKCPCPCGCGS